MTYTQLKQLDDKITYDIEILDNMDSILNENNELKTEITNIIDKIG